MSLKYFFLTLSIFFSSWPTVWGQIHYEKLVISPDKPFIFSSLDDILVADTLVMLDNSTLKLNPLKHENYIRVNMAIVGKDCRIDGHGLDGSQGRDGKPGETPILPCQDGENGRSGGNGLAGGKGVNLFLYFAHLRVNGILTIDLSGGNGGDGGDGGYGGGGSPGTIHCKGGNGGDGGKGGNGGNGGDGGTLHVTCALCDIDIRILVDEWVNLKNYGGKSGISGHGGYQGAAGLSKSGNGQRGTVGNDGFNGKPGRGGTLNFEMD